MFSGTPKQEKKSTKNKNEWKEGAGRRQTGLRESQKRVKFSGTFLSKPDRGRRGVGEKETKTTGRDQRGRVRR